MREKDLKVPSKLSQLPSRQVTLIQAHRGWSLPNLVEWWAYRDLLWEMVKRDTRVRYRQTALGWVWVIIQPLSQTLVYTLVFGLIASLPTPGDTPYALFIFVNMLGWGFFSGTVSRGSTSFIGQANLIKKVYFPRVVIPVASLLAGLVDLVVVLGAVLVLILLNGLPLPPRLITLPLWILLLALVASGITFWLSSLAVYYRDFRSASGLILQLWMYLTPVVYSETVIPAAIRPLVDLNPVVAPLLGIRWALLHGELPTVPSLVSAVVIGGVLFVTGMAFIRRIERNMADVI